MPDPKPWEKYAQQGTPSTNPDAPGPWSKYSGQATATPEQIAPVTTSDRMGYVAEDLGKIGTGALKGLMHTGTALSPLLNKIPLIGETLAPSSGIKAAEIMSTPKDTPEKIGYGGEQIAEWLLPTGVEEKGGLLAAKMLPKLGKVAAPLGRITAGALESGVRNKLQGGEFGSGALMGGGAGVVGESGKVIAPKLAESALHITDRMRGRGKTIGEAVLGEINAVAPSKIAKQAGEKIGSLTKEMESGVHAATQQGVTGTTQPAHDVLDAAIRNTPRNAKELRDKLASLRDVLSLKPGSGTSHTPDELLEIKRGIDKTIKTWGPEWQKIDDVQRIKQSLRGAIDGEIDRLVSGNEGLNQRISSLIPAKQQATRMSQGAGVAQRMAHRVAAHTGALFPAAAGAYYGHKVGGTPGMIAGALLPEVLASPRGQMWVARRMMSPRTTQLVRGASSQLMKRDADKSKTNDSNDKR